MIPNYLVFRQALPVSRKADHGVANVVEVLAHSVYRAAVSQKGAVDLYRQGEKQLLRTAPEQDEPCLQRLESFL